MRRRIISMMLLMAVAMSAAGQEKEAYKKALKGYLDATPATTASWKGENFANIYGQLNRNLMTDYDEVKSKRLIERYQSEQMMDDMVEVLSTLYQSNDITIDDLTILTNTFQTPEGQVYQQHLKKLNDKSLETFYTFGMLTGQMVGQPNFSVDNLQDLKVEDNIPSEYREKFDKFYVSSNLSRGIESSLSALQQQIGKGVTDYMTRNLKALYINEAYGVITMDDMDFGIKLGEIPSYTKQAKLMENMSETIQSVGMTVVAAYMNWLRSQGVRLKM